MNKAVLFKNWTSEDFTHKWDGVEYFFKAGSQMYLEEGLAIHFAKHLTNREIVKRGKFINDPEFKEMFDKCIGSDEIEAEDKASLETKIANEKVENKFCEFCDSKGVRHKKDCPTLKKSDEDEFEGK